MKNIYKTEMDHIYRIAAANTCGLRPQMEDAHCIIYDYDFHGTPITYIAVFDGHGGDHTAKWAADNLHRYVFAAKILDAVSIQSAFMTADADYAMAYPAESKTTGCTVAIAIITRYSENIWKIFTAHSGDTRVLIFDTELEPAFATYDHKPENPEETERIVQSGGCVRQAGLWYPEGPMRTNGDLSLSRALGDFRHKANVNLPQDRQAVIALPDISEHRVRANVRIVVACDGVFEQLNNTDIGYIIQEQKDIQVAAADIVTAALNSGSMDNISVVCLEWVNPQIQPKIEEPRRKRHAIPNFRDCLNMIMGQFENEKVEKPLTLANLHEKHPLLPGYRMVKQRLILLGLLPK